MKFLTHFFALLLGILPSALLAQPTSPEKFIAAYRAAMEEKSPEKLDALMYSEGMSEEDKQQATKAQQMVFTDAEIDSIALEPLPEDFQAVYIFEGKKLEPTYAPAGLIHTKYKTAGTGVNTTSAPYAVIDGKYFLISRKSTDLGWNGPPDKNLGFMVSGKGQDRVQINAKWNASGVAQEKVFTGRPSSGFWGQYFEEVTVTSTEDDTDVTLTVLESGEKIFVSERLKGAGTLTFKRDDAQ